MENTKPFIYNISSFFVWAINSGGQMKYIGFTKVALPYGWLGNMSPYKIIDSEGLTWKTAEAYFQGLRFDDKYFRDMIRMQSSPMSAKDVAKDFDDCMTIQPRTKQDVANMLHTLEEKLLCNKGLIEKLIDTGDAFIYEDVSNRKGSESDLFWGGFFKDEESFVGKNTLGKLWMQIRDKMRGKK